MAFSRTICISTCLLYLYQDLYCITIIIITTGASGLRCCCKSAQSTRAFAGLQGTLLTQARPPVLQEGTWKLSK